MKNVKLALILFCCVLVACTAHIKTTPPLALPGGRVSPAFEQWLSKQSMLRRAQELSQELSGSLQLWRHSAVWQDRTLLLRAAPTWLALQPDKFATIQSSIPTMHRLGFQGLWLSPLGENGKVWNEKAEKEAQVSFSPPSPLGTEKDILNLVHALEKQGMQSGTALIPAATGIGPDFMLQARSSSPQKGLYAMLELPERVWSLLPSCTSSFDCVALNEEITEQLRTQGLLPPLLWQEKEKGLSPEKNGWAVTGTILGMDGHTRRFAYRWGINPQRPVLLWQDPSGKARTLLTASVLQTTGLRKQTLAGIALAGLAGLDLAREEGKASLSPALEVLDDLSRQVHRCGGWSILTDTVTRDSLPVFLDKVDFVSFPALGKVLQKAFATERSEELALLLQSLVAFDCSRLAFGFSSPRQGFALPLGLPGLCFLPVDSVNDTVKDSVNIASLLSLNKLLLQRASLRIAEGKLLSASAHGSLIACFVALPEKKSLLTILNLANKAESQTIPIPHDICVNSFKVLNQALPRASYVRGQGFLVSLNARQAAHIILQ